MSSSGPILEGVIAINKPPAISSAQVIRDAQHHFNPSKLFAPWLQNERRKRDIESHNQKRKRKWKGRQERDVKMGHGGTLDPMATGVLILGIGSGTKQLHHFSTECTKTYETVLLFGAATDSYDTEGKIVSRKPYEHLTKEMVEEKLATFRGKGTQIPPIFSAIRVQGKRLYEYAREGKEVPVEIKERPVEVHELEMLEWIPGGAHKWHWPEKEAEKEEKQLAAKALRLEDQNPEPEAEAGNNMTVEGTAKRKRDGESTAEPEAEVSISKRAKVENASAPETGVDLTAGKPGILSAADQQTVTVVEQGGEEVSAEAPLKAESIAAQRPPCPAPACRIRMKVASGFYVRSLCHDLGAAVGSLGIMAELVRTQQGDFELGTNVLQYDELKQGEDVWGPKVQKLLEDWAHKHDT